MEAGTLLVDSALSWQRHEGYFVSPFIVIAGIYGSSSH